MTIREPGTGFPPALIVAPSSYDPAVINAALAEKLDTDVFNALVPTLASDTELAAVNAALSAQIADKPNLSIVAITADATWPKTVSWSDGTETQIAAPATTGPETDPAYLTDKPNIALKTEVATVQNEATVAMGKANANETSFAAHIAKKGGDGEHLPTPGDEGDTLVLRSGKFVSEAPSGKDWIEVTAANTQLEWGKRYIVTSPTASGIQPDTPITGQDNWYVVRNTTNIVGGGLPFSIAGSFKIPATGAVVPNYSVNPGATREIAYIEGEHQPELDRPGLLPYTTGNFIAGDVPSVGHKYVVTNGTSDEKTVKLPARVAGDITLRISATNVGDIRVEQSDLTATDSLINETQQVNDHIVLEGGRRGGIINFEGDPSTGLWNVFRSWEVDKLNNNAIPWQPITDYTVAVDGVPDSVTSIVTQDRLVDGAPRIWAWNNEVDPGNGVPVPTDGISGATWNAAEEARWIDLGATNSGESTSTILEYIEIGFRSAGTNASSFATVMFQDLEGNNYPASDWEVSGTLTQYAGGSATVVFNRTPFTGTIAMGHNKQGRLKFYYVGSNPLGTNAIIGGGGSSGSVNGAVVFKVAGSNETVVFGSTAAVTPTPWTTLSATKVVTDQAAEFVPNQAYAVGDVFSWPEQSPADPDLNQWFNWRVDTAIAEDEFPVFDDTNVAAVEARLERFGIQQIEAGNYFRIRETGSGLLSFDVMSALSNTDQDTMEISAVQGPDVAETDVRLNFPFNADSFITVWEDFTGLNLARPVGSNQEFRLPAGNTLRATREGNAVKVVLQSLTRGDAATGLEPTGWTKVFNHEGSLAAGKKVGKIGFVNRAAVLTAFPKGSFLIHLYEGDATRNSAGQEFVIDDWVADGHPLFILNPYSTEYVTFTWDADGDVTVLAAAGMGVGSRLRIYAKKGAAEFDPTNYVDKDAVIETEAADVVLIDVDATDNTLYTFSTGETWADIKANYKTLRIDLTVSDAGINAIRPESLFFPPAYLEQMLTQSGFLLHSGDGVTVKVNALADTDTGFTYRQSSGDAPSNGRMQFRVTGMKNRATVSQVDLSQYTIDPAVVDGDYLVLDQTNKRIIKGEPVGDTAEYHDVLADSNTGPKDTFVPNVTGLYKAITSIGYFTASNYGFTIGTSEAGSQIVNATGAGTGNVGRITASQLNRKFGPFNLTAGVTYHLNFWNGGGASSRDLRVDIVPA